MERRFLLLAAVIATLFAAACARPAPTLAEMARTWSGTAPKDDSYDTRCNDARRRLAEPLGEAISGLSRRRVTELLGEPDGDPHPEAAVFGADHLNYSLGWCDGDFLAYVVSFRSGRVVGARETPQ